MFDHAIYKLPRNKASTAWHQDEAYSGRAIPLRSVHFWIPLQDATIDNGCMWFIPGSNHGGVLPHHVTAVRTTGTDYKPAGATISTNNIKPTKTKTNPQQNKNTTEQHPHTIHYTG